jgi:methionyl aminopeptidase
MFLIVKLFEGIPDDRPLEDGDIINVDVTVFRESVHGDCSATFLIGNVDDAGRRLVSVAKACLDAGIAACGPGRPFADIGASIEKHAESHGFKVMPIFTGHGIGEFFHGPPDIYHLGGTYALQPGVMKPGMTFTVEPIISEGSENIVILEDGWTAMSIDNSRSAQFEHTVLVTETGCELLTLESDQ